MAYRMAFIAIRVIMAIGLAPSSLPITGDTKKEKLPIIGRLVRCIVAHEWREVTDMEERNSRGFHILERVRTCENCYASQKLETLYDFGSYSARGGPKVRGYRWTASAGRCVRE